MATKFEISPKLYQVRVYETEGLMKYQSSFSIFVDGNLGIIHNLIGAGFYKCIAEHIDDLFKQLGIDEIQGHVARAHLKAIQRTLSHLVTAECIGTEHVYGRDMLRIRVRRNV